MKKEALDGISEIILVHRAARKKVERIIARRKSRRQNVDKERNLKARLNRKIGNLLELQVELEAANSVVSAPTVAEIQELRDLVTQINDLATAGATREAALRLLEDAVKRASDLRGKIKT